MLGIMQSIASTIISYVLLCMLMIFLAFGIHNKHILMKNIAVLYGAALFTGGVFSFLGNLVTPITTYFIKLKKPQRHGTLDGPGLILLFFLESLSWRAWL